MQNKEQKTQINDIHIREMYRKKNKCLLFINSYKTSIYTYMHRRILIHLYSDSAFKQEHWISAVGFFSACLIFPFYLSLEIRDTGNLL